MSSPRERKSHKNDTVVIGIDGNEANIAQRVGSNVYAYELLLALYRWLETTRKFRVVVYVSQPPQDDMPERTDWWSYRVVPHAPLWSQWKLPWALRQQDELDLFFSPGHYTPSVSPVPVVSTIMDIAYEFYPQQFRWQDYWQLRVLTQLSVRHSQHVFAISESTQRDLVAHYSVDPAHTSVAYPGVKPVPQPTTKQRQHVRQQFAIGSRPYLLYVGTLQPRKNICQLVAAFEELAEQDSELLLVLAGKPGWQSEPIMACINCSAHRDRILLTGFVTDEQKNALMAEAETLVLPGLYEGFGMPPAEAIQLGTIPVVSNASSLPEVVGPDGITCDPTNPHDIAAKLQSVRALSAAEKKSLVTTLQQHVAQFRWEHTAQHVGETLWQLATDTRVL